MAPHADGYAERDAAMLMRQDQSQTAPWRRRTVGGDKNYDTHDFVEGTRIWNVTPHVTQNVERSGGSAINARTTRHAGYHLIAPPAVRRCAAVRSGSPTDTASPHRVIAAGRHEENQRESSFFGKLLVPSWRRPPVNRFDNMNKRR